MIHFQKNKRCGIPNLAAGHVSHEAWRAPCRGQPCAHQPAWRASCRQLCTTHPSVCSCGSWCHSLCTCELHARLCVSYWVWDEQASGPPWLRAPGHAHGARGTRRCRWAHEHQPGRVSCSCGCRLWHGRTWSARDSRAGVCGARPLTNHLPIRAWGGRAAHRARGYGPGWGRGSRLL